MRVLHLPVSYLPWTTGGKETYVHRLGQALQARGVASVVALHQQPGGAEPVGGHRHEGVEVRVLPPIPEAAGRVPAYTKSTAEAPGFAALLDALSPDVVHLHDFSEGAGLTHLRMAQAAGARTVMTYHSPGQSCLQRELLRDGRTVCDGVILPYRCTACRLTAAGLPRALARVGALGTVPGLDPAAPGRLARVLTARRMTEAFQAAWAELVDRVDVLHVHAAWARDLVVANGAPIAKVRFVGQGGPDVRPVEDPPAAPGGPLRVVFAGRCTPVKGVHVLVDAVRRLPGEVPVRVSLFGPYWDADDYGRRLQRRIAGDARFDLRGNVPPDRLVEALAGFDVCVVPSTWLETGPLTVLEAFAAGVPVVGSRLGGISELVRDGVDGLLFPPGDAAALAGHLTALAREPAALARLRAGVRPPRTQDDVARDLLALYHELADAPAAVNRP